MRNASPLRPAFTGGPFSCPAIAFIAFSRIAHRKRRTYPRSCYTSLIAPNMEKFKKFALHPATMFAAGAIAATAFAAVRKVAGYVAKFIPGASVPAE